MNNLNSVSSYTYVCPQWSLKKIISYIGQVHSLKRKRGIYDEIRFRLQRCENLIQFMFASAKSPKWDSKTKWSTIVRWHQRAEEWWMDGFSRAPAAYFCSVNEPFRWQRGIYPVLSCRNSASMCHPSCLHEYQQKQSKAQMKRWHKWYCTGPTIYEL